MKDARRDTSGDSLPLKERLWVRQSEQQSFRTHLEFQFQGKLMIQTSERATIPVCFYSSSLPPKKSANRLGIIYGKYSIISDSRGGPHHLNRMVPLL